LYLNRIKVMKSNIEKVYLHHLLRKYKNCVVIITDGSIENTVVYNKNLKELCGIRRLDLKADAGNGTVTLTLDVNPKRFKFDE